MSLPFVSRDRYEEMQDLLEKQIVRLEKELAAEKDQYKELRKHADQLAMAAMRPEPEVEEDQMKFPPLMRDVVSMAEASARERALATRR